MGMAIRSCTHRGDAQITQRCEYRTRIDQDAADRASHYGLAWVQKNLTFFFPSLCVPRLPGFCCALCCAVDVMHDQRFLALTSNRPRASLVIRSVSRLPSIFAASSFSPSMSVSRCVPGCLRVRRRDLVWGFVIALFFLLPGSVSQVACQPII